jgi:hypothetical protein
LLLLQLLLKRNHRRMQVQMYLHRWLLLLLLQLLLDRLQRLLHFLHLLLQLFVLQVQLRS